MFLYLFYINYSRCYRYATDTEEAGAKRRETCILWSLTLELDLSIFHLKMSFLEELNSLFGVQGLYEIIGVEKDASEAEIKKAYRRLSLKVHPDRVGSDQKDLATQKFQAISKVYSILSNKDLRAVYDESGEVGEEMVQQERDWMYYWRVLFPKITEEDIKKFEKQYKGSDEELNDLKSAYIRCEGDMEGICEYVMCSTEDDETRFQKILQNAIDNNELPKFDNFTKEDKKKKRARKEKVWVMSEVIFETTQRSAFNNPHNPLIFAKVQAVSKLSVKQLQSCL